MIHKKQIAQIAKNILRSQKGIQNHQLMHPSREWFIGLSIAAVFFAATVVWSSYTYIRYTNENITFEAPSEEQTVVYRESLVNSALELYSEKAQRYDTVFTDEAVNEPATSTETASSSQEVVDDLADDGDDAQTATTSTEVASTTPAVEEEQVEPESVEAEVETQESVDTEISPEPVRAL